jgi:hypothetical protein
VSSRLPELFSKILSKTNKKPCTVKGMYLCKKTHFNKLSMIYMMKCLGVKFTDSLRCIKKENQGGLMDGEKGRERCDKANIARCNRF